MKNIKKELSHWTPEDEKEHFPSDLEWWCTEGFFKTKDKKTWNLKAVFTEWYEGSKTGSLYFTTLFDIKKNKYYYYYVRNEKNKLITENDGFIVKFNDSYYKGLFPKYDMHFNDKENNIIFDIGQVATSIPHWIAQDITDGWLPLGLGSYRYGFIPKTKLVGSMSIENKKHDIDGFGYIEHVWGNFNYDNPFVQIKNIPNTLKIYSKLIGWRIHSLKPKIPKTIAFCSENNPFGYDWVWGVLDNGWTFFFGNIMFWIMDGPSMGTFILSKDDKTYKEFADVKFHYKKTMKSEIFDFVYPSEFTMTAKNDTEKLYLRFVMTCDTKEHIARFPKNKYWKGFVIVESPGDVSGYYFDGKNKMKLSGICKIEPQRQVSIFGHNMLKLDFLKPPDGVGIKINFKSNFLKKGIFSQFQLLPKTKIKFHINKTEND